MIRKLLSTFWLNALVIITTNVKVSKNTTMHYKDTSHQRSKVSEITSASSSQRCSKQKLPVLHLGWSATLRVSSEFARPPSPTALVRPLAVVQHRCLLSLDWAYACSHTGGGSPMHAPLQMTSPWFFFVVPQCVLCYNPHQPLTFGDIYPHSA